MAQAFPIAVLISGSGSTLLNILELIDRGRLDARVSGVIASRRCSGLEHAERFGVPNAVIERGKPFDLDNFSARITDQLDQWQPELLVFGGFLSRYILPPHYHGKAINIHPALLPGFGGQGMYGDRVHKEVLTSGTKTTGCTVHLVDDEYDHGAVIAQRVVPVLPGDSVETLGARVRKAERELYPTVIAWFAAGRVKQIDGKVEIDKRNLSGQVDGLM